MRAREDPVFLQASRRKEQKSSRSIAQRAHLGRISKMDNMFARLFNAHLKPAPAPDRWPDDLLLAQLTKKDALRLSDAFAGTFVSGRTGSGKTSGPGRLLAKRFLRANFGGLVLCQKNDEPDLWQNTSTKPAGQGMACFSARTPRIHSILLITNPRPRG